MVIGVLLKQVIQPHLLERIRLYVTFCPVPERHSRYFLLYLTPELLSCTCYPRLLGPNFLKYSHN